MRDDAGILNRPPPVETRSPGLPESSIEKLGAGFNPVNGVVHRTTTSFQPDESAPRLNESFVPRPISITPVERGDTAHSNHTAATSNWRPRESHPSILNPGEDPSSHISPSNKRKRTPSPVVESREHERHDGPNGADASSPKRRMISSGETAASPRPANREGEGGLPWVVNNSRRETPPRVGKEPPLPTPSSQVERQIAAQVQRLSGQTPHDVQPDYDSSEPLEAYRDRANSAEEANGGEGGDSKKRKRVFSNRTKTGCHTCRQRKKKCDEGRPTCQNCARGNFECGGYGPKPPGGTKIGSANGRAVLPLQAKQHAPYVPAPYHDGRYADHQRHLPSAHDRYHPYPGPRPDVYEPQRPTYGPLPPHFDSRPPSARENWPARPHSHWSAAPTEPPYLPPPPPSTDYQHVPPQPHPLPPPPPPPAHIGSDPSQYQVSPALYRTPIAVTPPSVLSSRASQHSSSSGGETYFGRPHLNTERDKMLRGDRYKHFIDPELIADRRSCRAAVEAYNDACKGNSHLTAPDREKYFPPILNPARRPGQISGYKWTGPIGRCDSHTMVETPLTCEYGYNIHLGKEVAIASNCTFQDANIIYIGDRTIVGPNVKFYCITTSVDADQRRGTQGDFQAGPIRVEADVVIGADTIIMPFRTIGKGAVVGAGSVVTRDVKPYTVVAGNPAKQIRKRKIEPGPNADRHNDDIQEQNEEMMNKLRRNEVIPRDD